MSNNDEPDFPYTRIPSAPAPRKIENLFVQVPGNPRYLTFRSLSLLEPRPRRAPEPPPPQAPEFQPPPPVRPLMPLPLPMMRRRDAEHVPCAEQRAGMDLILSHMTADEQAQLCQVSERYSKHAEWKRAQRGGATTAAGVENARRPIAKATTNAPGTPVLDLTDITAVPFVDDKGNTYKNRDGQQMMRPAGMDPHFFVPQGLKIRDKQRGLPALMALPAEGVDGLLATVITEAYQLYQFRRWGPWDAQRVGRKYRYEFVDYATVIIGLYAAAAGIPRDDILQIENYVANTSNYDKGTKFDKTYTHLLL